MANPIRVMALEHDRVGELELDTHVHRSEAVSARREGPLLSSACQRTDGSADKDRPAMRPLSLTLVDSGVVW